VIKRCNICKIDLINLTPQRLYCSSCRQSLDTYRETISKKRRRHNNPEPHRRKKQRKYIKKFQKKYRIDSFDEAMSMRQATMGEKFFIPRLIITFTKKQRTKKCRWCFKKIIDETPMNQRVYCHPLCRTKAQSNRKQYKIINSATVPLIHAAMKLNSINRKLKEVI